MSSSVRFTCRLFSRICFPAIRIFVHRRQQQPTATAEAAMRARPHTVAAAAAAAKSKLCGMNDTRKPVGNSHLLRHFNQWLKWKSRGGVMAPVGGCGC